MEQSHVLNLLVHADVGALTPTTAANSYINVLTALVDGELAVVNDRGMVLSAGTVLTDDRVAQTGIRIVARYGSNLVTSDFIKAEDIISVNAIPYAAPTEQVTYLGYNGTSGAINLIPSNDYRIKVEFWEEGRTGQGMRDFVATWWNSTSAPTGGEVVFGLENLLRLNFEKQAEQPIYLRVLNSLPLDGDDRFAAAVTATFGSKVITVPANWNTTGGVKTPAVGDFVRIGSAAQANAAVALGSTVYKVVAAPNATTIILDRPFTGVTAAYTANTSASLLKAAEAEAVNWGIEFHGIARPHDPKRRPYSKVRFTIGLENFGTTDLNYSTAMFLGHGTPMAMKDLEWFCHGQTGDRYRADYMHRGYTSRINDSATYHQLALTWASGSRTESIGGPGHNPKQLIIAAEVGYADTEAPDIVYEILEAYTTIDFGAITI